MTQEQIIEIACETVRLTWVNDSPEDLIAFAKAIIEADRESSDEPVAWMNNDGYITHYRQGDAIIPLYRHPPPARKLTDEEIQFMWGAHYRSELEDHYLQFARAIERRINGEEE